ncbi:MAG: hypothetical protein Q8Q20_00525 [bacterium]|nr:hypothetical protein [bacterium]
MEVWIFGNPDLPEDALPITLLPRLRKRFPKHYFVLKDPLDEWEMPSRLVMIDTVKGLKSVRVFSSLDEFEATPRVSMHDYDLNTQLRFLDKLGKLPEFQIVGVPDHLSPDQALEQVAGELEKIA